MIQGHVISLLEADPALAEKVCEYYATNMDFLRSFEPERNEEFFTPRFQRDALEQEVKLRNEKRSYRFYIVSNDEPETIIGTIGLSNIVWRAFQSCHLGYALDEKHRNAGFMTEAVNLITDFGFNTIGLHRIEANIMPRNLASLRVLEKCGFQNEGSSQEYLRINGVWEDHVHMVKLNKNWHEKRSNA